MKILVLFLFLAGCASKPTTPAESVFALHRDDLKTCYALAAQERGGIPGVGFFEFDLDEKGHLLDIQIAQSSMPKKAADCVVAAIRSWSFPAGSHGHRAQLVRFMEGDVIEMSATKPRFDPDAVKASLQPHIPEVMECYERALKTTPGLSGNVYLRMKIGEHGRVQETSVVSTTMKAPDVGICLAKRAKSWTFQAPMTKDPYEIVYPFYFEE